MRDSDIKILWGRSGNRCAICKLELTPDGDRNTLGEMAHIVAKSPNGPRGDHNLDINERDRYSNFILLCPTDHTNIDSNHEDWPVNRLEQIKQDHERWVSSQLDSHAITIREIDNSEFLNDRLSSWYQLSRDHVALALSLTPLSITNDFIDTMDEDVRTVLQQATYPTGGTIQRVSSGHTRPSEHGIINERIYDRQFSYSLQIFRSGHCEYFKELGHDVNRITETVNERGSDLRGARYAIRYVDIAEIVDPAVSWLANVWANIIPHEYLDFRCTLLHSQSTNLYSYADQWDGGVFGFPTQTEPLQYQSILSKSSDFTDLAFNVLEWISNCYGLVLPHKLEENGRYTRPSIMP